MASPRLPRSPARALFCVATLLAFAPSVAVARRATPEPVASPTASPLVRPACPPPARAYTLQVPGQPLSLGQTPDGCDLFVGFGGAAAAAHRGLALLHREGRSYALVRSFDLGGAVAALSIARDGSLLAARVLDHGIVLLDVARAIGGDPGPVTAELTDPSVRGPGALTFNADGSRLYATDAPDSAVLAIDVAAARLATAARPGLFGHRIALDLDPVALALAPDGTSLYVAVESRSPAKNLEPTCRRAFTPGAGGTQPQGLLAVLDLAHADRDGVAPVTARVDAGCTPVAVTVSSDGATIWTASTGTREIVAFAAAGLATPATAVVARTTLSFSPEVLGAVAGGAYLIAAGYEHAADLQHDVAVLTRASATGRSTLRARVLVGRFPRSILPFADENGAIVASYSSSSLAFLPISYLETLLEPPATRRHRGRPTRGPTRR